MLARRTITPSIAALLVVAVIGVTYLASPFSGDQAFFTLGAMRMHDGGVLYRDFWDIKQPGIFLFYLIAGTLFGFSENGIHLFELLYLIAFSVVLQQTLLRRMRNPWTAAIAPVLVVAWYYIVAGVNGYTQVEVLIGFPLYLSLYLLVAGMERNRPRGALLLAAGACAGIVVIFKLLYVIVIAATWLGAAAALRRKSHATAGFLIAAAGLVGTVLIAGAWCALTAGPQLVYYTFFVVPGYLVRLAPPPFSRLLYALVWYARAAAPLLVCAAAGLWFSRKSRDPIVAGCAGWIVAGLIAIVLQRQSWWAYQMMLFSVPVAILTARGLDAVPKRWTPAVAGVLLLASIPYAVKYIQAVTVLQRHGFARDAAQQVSYREAISANYTEAVDDTRFLRNTGASTGSIFVGGNPMYYLAAGRQQAVAMNGWAMELFLPAQWQQLNDELRKSNPPYVFITHENRALISTNASALDTYLHSSYHVLSRNPRGVWYAARYAATISNGRFGSAESVRGSTAAISR